jgi:tripartite-type tricarboxylate transporter receptor subunit TctC
LLGLSHAEKQIVISFFAGGLGMGVRIKLAFFLCLVLIFSAVQSGYAQEADVAKYPSRPVTLIVAFSPGGTVDLGFRLIAREAEKYLKQPIVVLNKAGGGGSIGVAAVASAKPDGYTVGQTPGQTVFVMPFLEKLPYNPARDLTYIMQFAEATFAIIVKGDSPFKSFNDLIVYARQNPKKLTYGTNAPTGIANLITEQIARKEKVQLVHIPFKGSPEAQAALLGDHIAFTAGEFNYSLVESGQIRVLALFSEKPRADYPQTPTLKDLGYDIPCPVFHTICGPKGIPDGIVKKLEDAFTKATREPAFIKGTQELRIPIVYRNSKELTEYVARNYEAFGKLITEMGLAK